jgi:Domain of unknown function (DUF4157)
MHTPGPVGSFTGAVRPNDERSPLCLFSSMSPGASICRVGACGTVEQVGNQRARLRRESEQDTADAAAQSPAVARTRLVVGAVDDPAEHEADAIADRVVQSLRGDAVAGEPSEAAGRIRRSASGPGSTETAGSVDADTERRIADTRGRGRGLPADLSREMGDAFGADFDRVRMHTGPEAAALNDRLHARAFTLGTDIFFRDTPDLGSPDGQHLLAHELTHTVQQSGADRIQRAPTAAPTRPPRRPPPAPPIKKARVLTVAQPVTMDNGEPKQAPISAIGPQVVEVDETAVSTGQGDYYRLRGSHASAGREAVYLPASALEVLGSRTTADDPDIAEDVISGLETGGELAGFGSGDVGKALGENTNLRTGQKETFLTDQQSGEFSMASNVSGSVSMFLTLARSIKTFRDTESSGTDKAEAMFDLAIGATTGAGAIAGMVDQGSKMAGTQGSLATSTVSDGAGGMKQATSASVASDSLGGIADSFSGIKSTFMAIKDIVDLANKAAKMSGQEKFKASMSVISNLLDAAKSGVSAAKSFIDLWGGPGGAALANTVPGLGIAIAACDIIVRAVDLVIALVKRADMRDRKRAIKAKMGGSRGSTFRTADGSTATQRIDALHAKPSLTADEEDELAELETYALAKGLQYINTKRANRALLKIGISMGKMAGDVATLGGASAPVGMGLKAGALALDVGSSIFRRVKQWGRDKAAEKKKSGTDLGAFKIFNSDKSTGKKLQRYNEAVTKMFDMIIGVEKLDPADQEAETKRVLAYVSAMGMSEAMLESLKSDPQKLRTKMIEKMKERE